MNLSVLSTILRAHLRTVLLTLIATVATTMAVSLLLPKTYVASTSLLVNSKGTDALTGGTVPMLLVPGYISTFMATQTDIIQSMTVAMKVVDRLKLENDPKLKEKYLDARGSDDDPGNMREWLAASLLDNLKVEPSRDSSILTINYKSNDPATAARIANAFAAAYQDVSIDMAVDPSRKAWRYISEQIKGIRASFEEAQKRVSKYQQDNNIVSADSRIDVETARLNELSNVLVAAQDELTEARSRKMHAQGARAEESADIQNNPVIQNLKVDLGRAQSRLATAAQTLTPEHPQYQKAKAEVDELRAALNAQIKGGARTMVNTENMLKQRVADAEASLEAQREKVLELNRKRDELTMLTNEMENARRAYETISQRLMQTNLQGHSNQSDIAVVNEALPPLKASSPKLLLNLIIAVVVGSLLGIAAAGLMELRDYRVRSPEILVESIGLPVLGVVRGSALITR